MIDNYDDIINLPHPISKIFPQMPMLDRAAQFAPFAALNGHSDAIKETARLTDGQITLSDSLAEVLDRKMALLQSNIANQPLVTITYFKPDSKKTGGQYKMLTGNLKAVDDYERVLIFTNGEKIAIHDIFDIEIEK